MFSWCRAIVHARVACRAWCSSTTGTALQSLLQSVKERSPYPLIVSKAVSGNLLKDRDALTNVVCVAASTYQDMKHVERIHHILVRAGMCASEEQDRILLQVAHDRKEFDRIPTLLHRARSRHGTLSPETINTAVVALTSGGRADAAADLVLDTAHRRAPLLSQTTQTVVDALCRDGQPERALQLLRQLRQTHNRSYEPNSDSYTAVVSAFCARNDMQSALGVLQQLQAEGVAPTPALCNCILEFLCAQGRYNDAERLFEGLQRHNAVDGVSYSQLLRTASDYASARQWLERKEDAGWHIDLADAAAVLRLTGSLSDKERDLVFQRFAVSRVSPMDRSVLYAALTEALCSDDALRSCRKDTSAMSAAAAAATTAAPKRRGRPPASGALQVASSASSTSTPSSKSVLSTHLDDSVSITEQRVRALWASVWQHEKLAPNQHAVETLAKLLADRGYTERSLQLLTEFRDAQLPSWTPLLCERVVVSLCAAGKAGAAAAFLAETRQRHRESQLQHTETQTEQTASVSDSEPQRDVRFVPTALTYRCLIRHAPDAATARTLLREATVCGMLQPEDEKVLLSPRGAVKCCAECMCVR